MGTQLFIYKVKNLDYAKNMIIEDIESFLATKCTRTYFDNKFQYLPLTYTKTIKIDLSKIQFAISPLKNSASIIPTLGDYVKTINQANESMLTPFTAYYYITNATWAAEKTVLLTLTLDVLNTFYGSFASKFSARTRTTRQHKDRFWNRSFGSGYYVRRFYDTNEGFNPSKFLTNKLYWNDPDSYGLTGETQKFYLIDKTPSQAEQEAVNKVVNSYLTFDNEPQSRKFVISASYDTFEDVLQNVATSSIVVIDAVNNPTMSYLDPSNNARENLEYKINKLFCIILYYEDNVWKLRGCIYQPTPSFDYRRVVIYNKTLTTPSDWKLDNCQFIYVEEDSTPSQFMNNHRTVASVVSTTQVSGTATKVVSDYSVVDTSDFTINNIFVLPYSPINLDIQYLLGNYVITNDKDISVDTSNSYLLRLKDDTKFSRSWTFNGTSIASQYLDIIYENNLIVKIADVSYIELESRLYGSEFFQWGIWFAGQQVLINNEKFKFTTAVSQLPVFKLNYKVSNSFSGHFLFKIEWLDARNTYGGLNDPEDLVLFVSKDNRNVLYQNNYLDYRKTMQQFDKQALAIAQSQSWFNVGSSIANSLLMSAIGSQSSGAVQRTIGLASSISASLGNAIFAQINNENSLRQKEASLAAQRTSIRAGADVDLQNAINGNKLYFVRYSASDELKRNLYQYFKYYGYACNDYGVPNLNTRRWYNYIECEADFNMSGLEVYAFYLAHIKEKLKQGCTIYHKYNNDWDLTQSNENWESRYTN